MPALPPKRSNRPAVGTLIEPDQPSDIILQGYSAFFITKIPLVKQSLDQQFVLLRPGLYGLERGKSTFSNVSSVANSQTLTLIPRREVSHPLRRLHEEKHPVFRRYVLLTYKPFKDTTQRQMVSRLLWQTPLIRFRPGLFLAPQIRAGRFREYQPLLIRPSEFVRKMIELGTTVWYAPRLEPYNNSSEAIIFQHIQKTFEERTEGIIETCRFIWKESKHKNNDPQWIKSTTQNLKRLRGRLRRFRAQMRFYIKEFKLDFRNVVSRAAAALSRVQQRLNM